MQNDICKRLPHALAVRTKGIGHASNWRSGGEPTPRRRALLKQVTHPDCQDIQCIYGTYSFVKIH